MHFPELFLLFWFALIFWVLGQIWLCQIVIYPLFARVGEVEYSGYHHFYASRIPLPVIVPGFASFLLPVAVAFLGPTLPLWMHALNILAGLIGLLLTVLLLIPRHGRLEKAGKDDKVIAELIRYNWPRTLSISAQSVVALLMLVQVFGAA
jgi:hypothetical protein